MDRQPEAARVKRDPAQSPEFPVVPAAEACGAAHRGCAVSTSTSATPAHRQRRSPCKVCLDLWTAAPPALATLRTRPRSSMSSGFPCVSDAAGTTLGRPGPEPSGPAVSFRRGSPDASAPKRAVHRTHFCETPCRDPSLPPNRLRSPAGPAIVAPAPVRSGSHRQRGSSRWTPRSSSSSTGSVPRLARSRPGARSRATAMATANGPGRRDPTVLEAVTWFASLPREQVHTRDFRHEGRWRRPSERAKSTALLARFSASRPPARRTGFERGALGVGVAGPRWGAAERRQERARGANTLSGQVKSGHFRRPETGIEFYFRASFECKAVWTLVRQLRGPHLSTWA